MKTLNVMVRLDEYDLRDAINSAPQDEALDAMVAMDLAIADAGFTEELIKRLAASLRGDMSADDFATLLAELAQEPQP